MKVFIHRYELKAPLHPSASSARASRVGCLLRIEWPDGRRGFADLHPWPELGDGPLDEQLAALERFNLTPLSEQAIYFADRDARARAAGEPLWRSGARIRNNFLVNDVTRITDDELGRLSKEGFTTVKIKCGGDIEKEAAIVNRIAKRDDFFVRLDFNGRATPDSFERFMSLVHAESDHRIEYVEDPFPYDHATWGDVGRRWTVGIDYELARSPWARGEKPAADVFILKPANMDVESSVRTAIDWGMDITVTSVMGHPVGVLHAHAVAQDLHLKHGARMRTAGCLTLGVYQRDPFAADIPVDGPFIGKPPGTGVGFDHLLESLLWTPISER